MRLHNWHYIAPDKDLIYSYDITIDIMMYHHSEIIIPYGDITMDIMMRHHYEVIFKDTMSQ